MTAREQVAVPLAEVVTRVGEISDRWSELDEAIRDAHAGDQPEGTP
jgi:hypothetical protein